MLQVDMHEAETRLSQLVGLAEGGERVVIARDGIPVVELARLTAADINRRGGQWKGNARIAEDFDMPMPELEEPFGN